MCIAFIAYKHLSSLPLVIAANRDEYYNRPTRPMDFWEDRPNLLAGRDLEAGGTWLGTTKKGRIALITNYREPGTATKVNAPSRGALLTRFLESADSIEAFSFWLAKEGANFNGFNLIYGTPESLHYYSNRTNQTGAISPGIHGLSNHLLDTPWPKITAGKTFLTSLNDATEWENGALFSLLANEQRAPDHQLPNTGVGLPLERALSPIFIKTPQYGTRCGTVLTISADGLVRVEERTYDRDPTRYQSRQFQFCLDNARA